LAQATLAPFLVPCQFLILLLTMQKFVLLLAFLACDGRRLKASLGNAESAQEVESVEGATSLLNALGMLLLDYNPSALPSPFCDQRLRPTRTLDASPRVGRISASLDPLDCASMNAAFDILNPQDYLDLLSTPSIMLPILTAYLATGVGWQLNGELTKARAAVEKANSEVELGLARAEEEKTALAKEMDEQKMRLESSIGSLKEAHEWEVDELQRKLSTIEQEKSRVTARLDDSMSEAEMLQKKFTAAREELKISASNAQKQVDKMNTMFAEKEAKVKSLQDAIDNLQTELDSKTTTVQEFQTLLIKAEDEKALLAKEVEVQLNAKKKTAAEKKLVVSSLEKQIEKKFLEANDLSDMLEAAEEERLELSSQITKLDKQMNALTEEKSALAEELEAEKKVVLEKTLSVAYLEDEKAEWLLEEHEASMTAAKAELEQMRGTNQDYLKALEELATEANPNA